MLELHPVWQRFRCQLVSLPCRAVDTQPMGASHVYGAVVVNHLLTRPRFDVVWGRDRRVVPIAGILCVGGEDIDAGAFDVEDPAVEGVSRQEVGRRKAEGEYRRLESCQVDGKRPASDPYVTMFLLSSFKSAAVIGLSRQRRRPHRDQLRRAAASRICLRCLSMIPSRNGTPAA